MLLMAYALGLMWVETWEEEDMDTIDTLYAAPKVKIALVSKLTCNIYYNRNPITHI